MVKRCIGKKNSRPNILATLNGRLRSPVAGFPRM